MTLRIGVLGASRIADLAIVGPAQQLGHRLVAVAARDRGRAELFAEKHGVERVLASYADVVADPEVNADLQPAGEFTACAVEPCGDRGGQAGAHREAVRPQPFRGAAGCRGRQAAGVTVMEGFHYLFHPVTRRALELANDGTIGEMHHVEVRMAMPAPETSDPRWSFEMAGGAMMDLGCYGLHVMRRLGHPSIIRAHAKERDAGVDEWCDVELGFPGGATGLSANTMAAPDHSFTLRIVGTKGDVFVHNFIKPHEDDRLTIRTPAGTRVEHHGTRTSYSYQLEAFARARAVRRAIADRHRRRGGKHGLCRCGVPGGRYESALKRRGLSPFRRAARVTAPRARRRPPSPG